MFTRMIVASGVLLVMAQAGLAADSGTYQKTRDGKTMVWNSEPKPGDEATWSGGRDREGYASGFGTLTWYAAGQAKARASSAKPELYARYFGNMVRGKLDGPVNVHARGVTHHAVFVEGTRTGRWARGTVPSWNAGRGADSLGGQRAIAQKSKPTTEPEAPAEGPRTPPRTSEPRQAARKAAVPPETEAAGQQQSTENSEPVVKRTQPKQARPPRAVSSLKPAPPAATTAALPADGAKPPVDDSLRLLTGPPPSLHVDAKPPAPATAGPARLTKQEVIDLADAQALSRGFTLGSYRRPDPEYNEADGTWSIDYEQTAPSESDDKPTHFSITVDDQTKGTVFVPGK